MQPSIRAVHRLALVAGLLAGSLLAAGCATTAAPSAPAVPAASPTAVAPEPGFVPVAGPLMLRDALLTLAGPAWELSVDDLTRQVCFSRHGAPTFLSANPPGTATPVPDADRPEEMQP
ncbi:hypothetical protein [Pseudomonas aeruginosa]|uniref:hypothetical protein n=1 Tax=Pseudomonas aeruginosa TaxID=287 RepID=UPI00140462ED|nr:hypothetical protein [Pseudomonas aeruginosa]